MAGRSISVALEKVFPLTGSRAPESGVYRRVVWDVFVVLTLVFIASWLPIAVPDFECA